MNRTLRWLIIEDSKEDAVLLISLVRSVGYEPLYEVVDTESAMRAALERDHWDLITSDHSMPQFSAPAALAIVTELHSSAPFIVVSGEIDLPLAISLMKNGARDYIQKKELARLAPAIERALHDSELELDRLLMVQTLAASESRYRRLFESAQDGILILNAETAEIDDVNPFMIEMLGYTREQFLGKKVWDLGAGQDAGIWKSHFRELQNHGYIRYHDLPLEAGDGRSIDVEFVSNIYLVNRVKVIQCNIRDITRRAEVEARARVLRADLENSVDQRTAQLELLNHELETFNYSVSHDLRAPLRRIQGFVDLMEKHHAGQLDAEGRHLLRTVQESAMHMNTLIEALLRLAQFSSAQILPQSTDLSSLAHLISDELQLADPLRRVSFTIAGNISVNGDPELLRVLLENLLGNAWKFTARQTAARIEFGSVLQSNSRPAYFVKDNGAGFNMKYADKLFGAFQRLHSQEDFSGTGIGLASVQRIVHRHGGRIWALSAPGEGAAFYFTLNGVQATNGSKITNGEQGTKVVPATKRALAG